MVGIALFVLVFLLFVVLAASGFAVARSQRHGPWASLVGLTIALAGIVGVVLMVSNVLWTIWIFRNGGFLPHDRRRQTR